MIEHGMYFGKKEFYELIRQSGGQWNDTKDRPLFCVVKSVEDDDIFWAVPVGNWNHRNTAAKERIQRYLSFPEKDIRSCYYHIGNTDVRSIFFISDAVPITDDYIEREYLGKYTNSIYLVRNNQLISELNRKLSRILAWEKANPNHFRQNITSILKILRKEDIEM